MYLEDSDIDFINKYIDNLKPMEEQNGFPKYQYSEFVKGGGRDGQIVIRTNSWDEFSEQLKQLNAFIKGFKNATAPLTPENDVAVAYEQKRQQETSNAPTQSQGMMCPNCNSKMWDNRPKKATGEYSISSPDFKCSNKGCGHVIWPAKN